mgnify:CR=1 FL=1
MYNKFLIFILLLLITILAIFSINMEDDYNIEDEIDEAIDEDLEQDNVYDESLKPVQYNPNMRNFISESFGISTNINWSFNLYFTSLLSTLFNLSK